MKTLSKIFAGIVAIEHLYFLVLEMFLWTKPLGLKTFKNSLEFAQESAALAMNQGLYNGFLAAGILWAAFLIKDSRQAFQTLSFFLGCVIVAGVFGGITVAPRIAVIQAVPALLALIFTILNYRKKQT